MKPVNCTVKDDPANGSYGDCVRACVASILEMESEQVPHFFHDEDGERANMEMQKWLAEHGMIAAFIGFPGNLSFEQLAAHMTGTYMNRDYMLWCQCGSGDHALVARNDAIIHNPAWYKQAVTGPHSSGYWIVVILARI